MTATCALDNDVVLKLAYFGLLDPLLAELSRRGSGAVLGTAKFVIRRRIAVDGVVGHPASTLNRLDDFLAAVEQLEPDPSEVMLATRLEEFALTHQLDLDAGESLLCSILVHRSMERLVTGDKRAIRAIDALVVELSELSALRSAVACLEQLVVSLSGQLDPVELRSAVCSARATDKALASCFNCQSPEVDPAGWLEGATSYVEHLRRDASTVLVKGLAAWNH